MNRALGASNLDRGGRPLRFPIPSLFRPVVTRDRRRLDPSRGDRTLRRPTRRQVRGDLHLFRRGLDPFPRDLDQFRRDLDHFRHRLALPRPDPTRFRHGRTLFRFRAGFICRNFAGFDVEFGSLSIDSNQVRSFMDQSRASLAWLRWTFTKADPSLTLSALDFTKDAGEVGNPARELAKSTRSCKGRKRTWLPRMRNAPGSERTRARTPRNYPGPQRKRSLIRCAIRLLARQRVPDAGFHVAATGSRSLSGRRSRSRCCSRRSTRRSCPTSSTPSAPTSA
jgi:hypothetical protein